MYNYGKIKFKNIEDKYGKLVPIESKKDVPFEIKRIYYISNVGHEVIRGHHSHRALHQILICISGSVKIKIKSPTEEQIVELDNNSEGIYIGPMIWREMFDFSEDAVLLVLASEYYDEADYIRNYDFYLDEAKNLF